MDSLTSLFALVGTVTTGIIIAIFTSRWALLLYCNQDLQKRDKFFKYYDQFVREQGLKLLQGCEDKFSDEYKAYVQLHQDTRETARSYCIRYMGSVSFLTLIIVLFIPMTLVLAAGSLYPLLLILLLFASMAFRITVLKQGGQFHRTLILKIIFRRVSRKKK